MRKWQKCQLMSLSVGFLVRPQSGRGEVPDASAGRALDDREGPERGVSRSTRPQERPVPGLRDVHLLRHQQRHRPAHLQGCLPERGDR